MIRVTVSGYYREGVVPMRFVNRSADGDAVVDERGVATVPSSLRFDQTAYVALLLANGQKVNEMTLSGP